MSGGSVSAIRGTLVSFSDDPFLVDPAQAFRYEADGLIICRNGLIEAVGPYSDLRDKVPAGAAPPTIPAVSSRRASSTFTPTMCRAK